MPDKYSDLLFTKKELEELRKLIGADRRSTRSDAIETVSKMITSIRATNGVIYAFTESNDYPVVLKGPDGRRLIRSLYSEITGKKATTNTVNEITDGLEDEPVEDAVLPADPRIYYDRHNRLIYHDLFNNDHTCVRMSASGPEIVKQPHTFAFHRGVSTQKIPEVDMNGTFNDLMKCFDFIGLTETKHIVIAYMAQMFSMAKERLILYAFGKSGTGKSTLCKMIAHTVDPQSIDFVNAEMTYPGRVRDMMATAIDRCVLAYGNEATIPTWLSNELCKRVTGGAFSECQLFTQGISLTIEAIRSVVINSLHLAVNRPDLLSRCVVIPMRGIKTDERLTPTEIESKYESLRPKMLGALYKAVSMGLRRWDSVRANPGMERYSEFCRWITAISPEWGWHEDYFPRILQRHINSAMNHAAKISEIVQAISAVMSHPSTNNPLVCTYSEMAEYIIACAPWYRDTGRLTAGKIRDDVVEQVDLLAEVGIRFKRDVGSKHGSPTSQYWYVGKSSALNTMLT